MDEPEVIKIFSGNDIILARMRVREMARLKGFDSMGQACISLATSSLAYALGLDRSCQGQIAIDCFRDQGCTGIRVICTKTKATGDDLSSGTFAETRRMVDELKVEMLPSDEVRVIVIKWKDEGHRALASSLDSHHFSESAMH